MLGGPTDLHRRARRLRGDARPPPRPGHHARAAAPLRRHDEPGGRRRRPSGRRGVPRRDHRVRRVGHPARHAQLPARAPRASSSTRPCRAGAGASPRRTTAEDADSGPQSLVSGTAGPSGSPSCAPCSPRPPSPWSSSSPQAAEATPATTTRPTPPRPTATRPRTGAADAGGLTVTDGITPDDLLGCLTDAGLDAGLSDARAVRRRGPGRRGGRHRDDRLQRRHHARAPSSSSSPIRPPPPTTPAC